MPVAVGNDDFAGRRLRCSFSNSVQDIVDRSGSRQIDARPAADAVEMVVGQARNDRLPAKIDLARRRTSESACLLGCSDQHEAAAADGDRLSHALCAVYGQDLAVEQNKIGQGGLGKVLRHDGHAERYGEKSREHNRRQTGRQIPSSFSKM